MEIKMKEADMYLPVKGFFENHGYEVHGEVKGIDATATRGHELVLLEFKTSFNLKLLYQALDRQKLCSEVYVVIPRPQKQNSPSFKKALHILKRLELGLITVAMDSPMKTVEVQLAPAGTRIPISKYNQKKKDRILMELSGRSLDGNQGGSVQTKLLTAYREKSLKAACVLYHTGPLSAAKLVKEYGCDKTVRDALYGNHYGWFERAGRGVYGLTAAGRLFIERDDQFRAAIDYYMAKPKSVDKIKGK